MPSRVSHVAFRATAVVALATAAALAGTTGSSAAVLSATSTITIGGSATAQVYAWGAATMPDGSVLLGDYWNLRIVHYTAAGSQASPFVFAGKAGFGAGHQPGTIRYLRRHQQRQGCRRRLHDRGQPLQREHVQPDGNFHHQLGQQPGRASVNFDYPSQCAVNPVNGKLYISNQWGQSMVILDPSNPSAAAQFISPPAPNTFIQPRGPCLRQRRQPVDRGSGAPPHRYL